MLTYEQAMNTLKARTTKKLANNTYLRYEDGKYIIRLHQTDIITITADDHYILNSGGWRTSTTKQRINEFTNARLYQEKHIWYMRGDNILFFDGVEIDENGDVCGNLDNSNIEEKRNKWIDKHISAFCKEMKKLDKMPFPEGGDCWGCHFVAEDRSYPMGSNCILDHIVEKYIHGSLVVRAMRWAGYSDANIWFWYNGANMSDRMAQIVRRFLWDWCQKHLDLIPIDNKAIGCVNGFETEVK